MTLQFADFDARSTSSLPGECGEGRLGRGSMKRTLCQSLQVLAVLGLTLVAAGCSRGGAATRAIDLKGRPPSSAAVAVVEPLPGTVVAGSKVRVRIRLTGGRIILQTTTQLRPDEGHVHLSVDGTIVSMTYGLEQEVVLPLGRHLLEAEFVAGDHLPFNPRVIATTTVTVK